MFRDLANLLPGAPVVQANQVLTRYTPLRLARYLELVWSAPRTGWRPWNYQGALQAPAPAGVVPATFSQGMARSLAQFSANYPAPPLNPTFQIPTGWGHLIGALMIENTGVVEIVRELLKEWTTDERLPFATLETQYWMRATEELFFTSPSPVFTSLTSDIRRDAAAIRENAYLRFFGVPVSYRRDGAEPPTRPRVMNTEFIRALERLLYEVWRGYTNRLNANNLNTTDQQAVAELVREIREMLTARRVNATLLREEFAAVAMLSWFHLTVEYDTYPVANLNAQSSSAANRLKKMAAHVNMTPSRVADSYFHLADPLSLLLMIIENGALESAAIGVQRLYDGIMLPLTTAMQVIITHWEKATGRTIKDGASVRPLQVSVAASLAPATAGGDAALTPMGTN
jgi:hypothetical protein